MRLIDKISFGKITKKGYSVLVIHPRSLFFGMVSTDVLATYRGTPWLLGHIARKYAFVTRANLSGLHGCVSRVFCISSRAKIGTPVIKGITVYVVNWATAKNQVVDTSILIANMIVLTMNVPFMRRNKFNISGINNGLSGYFIINIVKRYIRNVTDSTHFVTVMYRSFNTTIFSFLSKMFITKPTRSVFFGAVFNLAQSSFAPITRLKFLLNDTMRFVLPIMATTKSFSINFSATIFNTANLHIYSISQTGNLINIHNYGR